jgi:tRNA-Thr(GGU) m(6)t(6)A37 methyltransferase TsaA
MPQSHDAYSIVPIGWVRSTLKERTNAPRQGREGAPDAWLEFDERVVEGLEGLAVGHQLIILTWLHEAERKTLKVRPRSDPLNRLTGVFATRSPDRPNPIGLHRVRILALDGNRRIRVQPLEAIDGTPIIDVKPVLDFFMES